MIGKIEADLLEAMKSGDTSKRDTLRMLKSALKNSEIEKGSELSDEEAVTAIQKELKRRKEAIDSFTSAGRVDQAAQEQQEAEILSAYLPSQMSEDEIRTTVTEYLTANPANTADVGRVMGQLSSQLKGKADLGLVAKIVRESVSR